MNLLDYVRILIRRGWIIALAVGITAVAAYAYSQTQTEIYRASQKVLLTPQRNDLGLSETLRTQMASYVEYLNTDAVAAEVIATLNLDMQPGALRSDVSINSNPTTLVIQIDVDLEDGPTAAAVATEWGRQLVEYRAAENSDLDRGDRIGARLLDTAGFGLHQPNTRVNVLAGAVLGLIVGGIVVFVLEVLEANIVRRANDLERIMETPLLAAIPATDRRGGES